MQTRKVTLVQRRTETQRLQFVKALKDLTGFGLKESKDICDHLNYSFNGSVSKVTFEVPYDSNFQKRLKDFQKTLRENCTGVYDGMTIEYEREAKILELGLGDKNDYISFIIEYIPSLSNEDAESVLKEVLSNLTEEKLKDIFNKVNNKIKLQ